MDTASSDIRNRLLVARLPALPQILLKLMELCQSEDAGMTELARLIANDAAVTARMFAVANSAAYQRGARKMVLVQALSALGVETIKTLVISESVYQTFSGFEQAVGVDLRGFWKHALTAAVLAREVARKMGYPHLEEAYLAGLLHDVGRLALLTAAPAEYGPNFLARDDTQLCAVEQQVLLINHAEAGAWLAERWHLDALVADAILYHHEPLQQLESAHPLVRIVALAHLLGGLAPTDALPASAQALCPLAPDEWAAMASGAAAQVEKSAQFLGLDLAGLEDAESLPARLPAQPVPDPARQRLNEEVRNMALLAEIGQSLSRQRGDAALLEAARHHARNLFHWGEAVVFLSNDSGQSLACVSASEALQRLAELSVPLAGGGVLADAAVHRRVEFLVPQERPLSVPERQLLRLMEAQALVCVPLATGGRSLGLLLGSVLEEQRQALREQGRFLQAYGALVAKALAATSSTPAEIDRRIDTLRKHYHDSARQVAHEVNNPLAIIKNYLGVLDDKIARHEPVDSELRVIGEEIDRVGGIVNDFASSGAPAAAAPQQRTEVNRVIADLVRLFRDSRFMPAAVQISSRLPPQACEIEGGGDVLKQVLVNLIKNAVEAFPGAGNIEVSNLGVVQRAGRAYVALQVRDDGPGIPEDVQAQLFSPVRSTKAGSNRGIGLSIVHGLVRRLQGHITCASTRSGTVFDILLPAARASGAPAAATGLRQVV